MFDFFQKKNIPVITSFMPHLETCAFGIFIKWGARFEETKLKGIAHFIEHMLFKGTKKYSYRQIKQQIEGRGGSINGFTSQEVTAYYAQFLKKNLSLTANILCDMVERPLLASKEIEKERNVILEEIKMYRDLPHARALSLMDELLWEAHPLGSEVIGYDESIKRIHRYDLERYRKTYYQSPYVMAFCVGAFDPKDLSKALAFRFNNKSGRHRKQKSPLPLRKQKMIIESKPIDQTHICLGFRGISYSHRYRFAIELLHIIMGANMSSRLFEEVREKRGLCYDVSTEVKKYKDSGAFIIHCGLDKKNVQEAIRCIIQQLQKIKTKAIGNRELDRAKDYLLGQLAMNLERPMGRLFYLADSFITLNRIYMFEEIKRKILEISPDTIRDLARGLFHIDKMCLTAVGDIPQSQTEIFAKVIKKEQGKHE